MCRVVDHATTGGCCSATDFSAFSFGPASSIHPAQLFFSAGPVWDLPPVAHHPSRWYHHQSVLLSPICQTCMANPWATRPMEAIFSTLRVLLLCLCQLMDLLLISLIAMAQISLFSSHLFSYSPAFCTLALLPLLLFLILAIMQLGGNFPLLLILQPIGLLLPLIVWSGVPDLQEALITSENRM